MQRRFSHNLQLVCMNIRRCWAIKNFRIFSGGEF